MSVGFTINESVLRHATQETSGMTGQWMFRRMNSCRNRAVNYCPVVTGRLRSSITVTVSGGGRGVEGTIGSNVEYAKYVHEGRGPVRPVSKSVLHFITNGTEVFTKYAGPAEGQPFLLRAVQDEFS